MQRVAATGKVTQDEAAARYGVPQKEIDRTVRLILDGPVDQTMTEFSRGVQFELNMLREELVEIKKKL